MIDKLWYDWQNGDPMNVNSFYGGSVEYIYSLAAYDEYPNGGPPYLNVSTLYSSTCPFRNRGVHADLLA